MTAGQQLIEEGRQQGIQQERQRFQALLRLLRLLRQRFGDVVQPHIEQRVEAASSEQLDIWTLRMASGASLAEIFAD